VVELPRYGLRFAVRWKLREDTRMTHSEPESLQGHSVEFLIRDIHLPDPAVILEELHGEDILRGRVVDCSKGGREGGAFVVIEVEGRRQPCLLCVLAVEKIKRVVEQPCGTV
jgi:hypothetical protein